ncbi:MAG TPA: small multi-drug export protein [Thermoanaerobaculia bacterium]|nr:small multi-drug export protein [Thermoanaerobaculia bacterium]
MRPELRRIHRAGWSLFLIWAAALIGWGISDPEPYAEGWRLVLELAFLGRLVSISDGVVSGFGNGYLIFQNSLQDIILLLVVYPWAVAGYEGAPTRGLVRGTLERFRRSVERHRARVEPWGVLGLWAFVFFPFWSTGALVGGALGYLLGMRTWLVFASVFAGHVLSVMVLVVFFDATHDFATRLGAGWIRFLPWIVLAAIVTLSLAVRGVRTLRARRPQPGTSPE